MFRRRTRALVIVLCFAALQGPARAAVAGVDPSFFAGFHWRSIGPYRGGRTVAVAGVPGDAATFYSGSVGGGIWKTTNAGRTWLPIADALPVSSIGALAVAPSVPSTIYAGSGEADMRSDITSGGGMFRSSDAGATWVHIGLDDTRQIGRILVDPHDANTLLVAALGHAYGPNDERGVYRSTDGGATWTRTLFHDRDTGAIDLAATPDGATVYASLWQTRRPPWNTYPPSNGPGSGLYVSHDRGVTWQALTGSGFPSIGLGKVGLAVASSDPKRVYAIVDAKAGGLYRSDDAGGTWRLVDGDQRLWDRGWYFDHVVVDPADADRVYVSDTSVYRSLDGGATFEAIKGSPDGDDFHQLWIDPQNGKHLALASDQGTAISLDGATSWSSWFNQPTGQFYHVATDDAFPYRLYGAQQDSGAARILSRSAHRGIEARDWEALTAGGESGYLAPDPRDPSVVYGDTVTREDLRTRQSRNVSPATGRPGVHRGEWTLPLVFGPDHALYFADQKIYRSRTGGDSWTAISGDLARPRAGVPATLDAPTAADAATGEPRGVVYALAPSPSDPHVLWAGTDDGLVYVTRDGAKTWQTVTPPGVEPWSHVVGIEASHFDSRSAYVAVDRHRLDDVRPYLYVTHDAGATWRSATGGIPSGSYVNAVREDPVRRGLLYAATETGVYVSFDDGANWQSLRLDMPVVSVRDLAVHADDLAIATHGRAFWVLDDVEPLREFATARTTQLALFQPRAAIRTRPGDDEAEATPPETPLGENPPDGAIIDYAVPPTGTGRLELAVLDAAGAVIRRYASDAPAKPVDPHDVPFPAYWLRTPLPPSAAPGMHRFVWDFHLDAADGPLAAPGTYTVRIRFAGREVARRLVLRRDPRIAADDAALTQQMRFARSIAGLRDAVRTTVARASSATAESTTAGAARARIVGMPPAQSPDDSTGSHGATDTTSLRYLGRLLDALEASVESADAAPTSSERAAFTTVQRLVAEQLRALHRLASAS